MLRRLLNRLMPSKASKETKHGKVKFFNSKKGFGFIIMDDTQKEIFVHSSNLVDKIKENKKVTFQVEKSEKGLIAVNVKLA